MAALFIGLQTYTDLVPYIVSQELYAGKHLFKTICLQLTWYYLMYWSSFFTLPFSIKVTAAILKDLF